MKDTATSTVPASRDRGRAFGAGTLLFCALFASSCTDSSPGPPIIRLVPLLSEAEVQGPLTDLAPANSLADLGPVTIEESWSESFESADSSFSLTDGCALEPDRVHGGFTLACLGQGRAKATLSLRPGSGYRISFDGRQDRQPPSYAVKVIEQAMDSALRVFQLPDLDKSWGKSEIWLFSHPDSRSLEILIEPQLVKEGRIWLDNFVVERLDLSRDQELRLLKALHPYSQQAPELGMAKRGRLLPTMDPEVVDSPLHGNWMLRDALMAPPPTDIHYDLRIPAAARLALSYALLEHSSPDTEVSFRVLIEADGEPPQPLLAETLSWQDGGGRRWHERELSLAGFGGRDVRLTFETRTLAGSGRAYPLWGSPEIYRPRRRDEPPNVILIAVDTLRADHLSCYGSTEGASPAIDALAADGVRFEQAIASANWTVPSFLSLFTGRTAPDLPESLDEIPDTTLAESFQQQGYSTAALLYKSPLFDKGFERGFDTFFNAPRYNVRAEDNLAKALSWLRRNRERLFFLFLHFNDPHQPFCQPEQVVDGATLDRLTGYGLRLPIQVYSRDATTIDSRYPATDLNRNPCRDCREDGRLTASFRELMRDLYENAVRYADQNVGTLISFLKEHELYDDAVIAFVSDHGEALWDRGDQFTHGRDNLHDELIRVPLIIKPPRGYGPPAIRVATRQVRLHDLMPTLQEMAGIEPPDSTATSLMPAFRSPGATGLRDRPAFSRSRRPYSLSVRHEGWKYIRHYPKSPDGALREVLYDLADDPGERTNLASEEPPALERMRRILDEQLISQAVGRVVLIKADPHSEYRVRIRWNRETELGPFPQPGLRPAGSKAWELSIDAKRSLLLLTSFITSDDASVDVSIRGGSTDLETTIRPEGIVAYRPGFLNELLTTPGVHVRVVAGRDPTPVEKSPSKLTDARQLDALKALGYLQ